MKRRLLALLLIFVLVAQSIAAGLPDLGDVGAGDLSPLAERRIGEQAMREIRSRESAYLDDPEIEDYLNRLGARLAAVAPATLQTFSFFAVRDPTLNAFALPGGFIGVHSGLIVAAQSESELASVLGHEIGHVTQRHIAQMVGTQGRTGLLMLASLIVAVLAAGRSSQGAQAAIATGSAAGLQTQLSYSRDFEREADRVGLQILDDAGFDVRGMPSFFERLQRESRLYENDAPVYLRTHPLTAERIADIGNRTQQHRYRQVEDSLPFRLVRAKLIVDGLRPGEPNARFDALLAESPSVKLYAKARAALNARNFDEAAALIPQLEEKGSRNPMFASLAGEIRRASGQWDAAVAIYQRALQWFPDVRSLVYGLAEARLGAGRAREAAGDLRVALAERSGDARLWMLMSRAQAMAGSASGRHRAQAEVYRLQGALSAAVEQLELAQKAGDADFYEASAIDSRLRELRVEFQQEKDAAKANRN